MKGFIGAFIFAWLAVGAFASLGHKSEPEPQPVLTSCTSADAAEAALQGRVARAQNSVEALRLIRRAQTLRAECDAGR